VEELGLADLNLGQRQGIVRQGKGMQDRAVYLTETAVIALQAYLDVRGDGLSDHVFLYRHRLLGKDFLRGRLKAAGERMGVKVTPHQLRHTYATQLLNAGCRVTTIQALLGHRRLNSTMTYARVHDHTVMVDYFMAMEQVEQRLVLAGPTVKEAGTAEGETGYKDGTYLLRLVDTLDMDRLEQSQREVVAALRDGILALAV
jgi:integrase